MQEQPLVSIIIPTFNRAHLIGETLDSVLAQTYQNWECIVVDDGSTDGTDVLMGEYVAKDTRFQYHHRPDDRLPGGNAARNYGFEVSKGEYIIFLDSDDLLNKYCLENRVRFFNENHECNFLVFKMGAYNENEFIENNLKVSTNDKINLKDFLNQNYPWNITGPIWKKSFITDNLYFDERLTRYQDIDFHIRALLKSKEGYRVLPITDCYYRRNEATSKKFLESNFKMKIVTSYYYLICNIINEAPVSTLNIVEKDLKYGLFKVVSKFADKNNIHILKSSYVLLEKNINFKLKERLYYNFLCLLSVYYKNKRGYFVLRRPIISYFENQLQNN